MSYVVCRMSCLCFSGSQTMSYVVCYMLYIICRMFYVVPIRHALSGLALVAMEGGVHKNGVWRCEGVGV
jgi:hypothetical protein